MANLETLSATKINILLSCPQIFKSKYIDHEPVPQSINLVFGKEVHYFLEQFYKKDYKSATSFCNSFNYRWSKIIAGDFLKGKAKERLKVKEIPIQLRNGEEYIMRIGDHIRFFEEIDRDTGEVVNLDRSIVKWYFAYKHLAASFSETDDGKKIATDGILKRFYDRHKHQDPPDEREKRFKFNFRGYPIIGVWDRIDRRNGDIFITDYKTDKSYPKSIILHTHLQFTIYSAAFREIFGETERDILYYHLRSGKVYKTRRGEHDYDTLEKVCERVTNIIQNKEYEPRFGFQCGFCDYHIPCINNNPHLAERILNLDKSKIVMPEEFDGWLMDEER